MKTSLRVSLIAAAIAALPVSASAAGLGRLNVYSVLGQPLRAEVEVSGSAEEIESLSARLASPDAFRRANIDYSAMLASLRIAVERRNSGAILKLSSDKPLNEPFVDMLLELNWAGGRLVREYTFLLDPAESHSEQAAVTQSAPAAEPRPAAVRTDALPRSEGRHRRAVPAERPAVETDGHYTVKPGDSLGRIARELKPSEASPEQMLAALYSANSTAFPKGNINRLASGQVLKVPAAEQVKALSEAEVKRLLSATSANFSAYRQKLASAAAATPAKEAAAQQSSAGKITPKSEESARIPEQKDRLRIAKSQIAKEGGKGDKSGAGRVQALEEDLVAREKSLKDANERVAALEKNVKDLQSLLELKNQRLADAQKQAVKSAKPAEAPKAVKPVDETKPLASASQPEKVATKLEAPTQSVPVAKASAPAAIASAPVAVASVPVAAASAATEVKPAPKLKPAPKPVPEPVEEPGFFASLLEQPMLLGGVGVALLGLGGLLVYRARRRREDAETTALNATQTGTESVIGLAGGQTVDTGTSVLPTDFSQSGLYSIDADEGVDPVAEADVYMAYGRDAQAEEILLDALKADPSRSAIHLKLLEVYALRKSLKQFESIATDLYTQTGAEGAEWAKAAEMGRKLDPDNPLYQKSAEEDAGEDISFVEPAQAVASSSDRGSETEPSEPLVLGDEQAIELELPEEIEEPEPISATESFVPESGAQMQATWTMPGEVGQISRDTPDEIQAAVEETREVKSQDLGLDFNLDLDVSQEETTVEVPPLTFETSKNDEVEALPFETAAKPAEEPLTLDLDGFDLPADATAELGLEPAYDTDTDSLVDLEKTSLDVGSPEFDFDISREVAAQAGKADDTVDRTIDLSQINLELPEEARTTAAAIATQTESQLLNEEINVDQEVETKLELARAYEDMRDFEGARELLEEVLQDGSDAQKREAETIIARLA